MPRWHSRYQADQCTEDNAGDNSNSSNTTRWQVRPLHACAVRTAQQGSLRCLALRAAQREQHAVLGRQGRGRVQQLGLQRGHQRGRRRREAAPHDSGCVTLGVSLGWV